LNAWVDIIRFPLLPDAGDNGRCVAVYIFYQEGGERLTACGETPGRRRGSWPTQDATEERTLPVRHPFFSSRQPPTGKVADGAG
jgi:hypothetical protein